MEIVAINGSPKAKGSVSGLLIEQIEQMMQTTITVFQARKMTRQNDLSQELDTIRNADILLVVFPLYIDSLPAALIEALSLLEEAGLSGDKSPLRVYALCNCGFYEAQHTSLALQMIKRFAIRTAQNWGFGIGIGCGGILLSQSENMAKGPTANVYAALNELCNDMAGKGMTSGGFADMGTASYAASANGSRRENLLITPKLPRFLYKLGGNMGFSQMAKKSGVRNTIDAKPHLDAEFS